MNRYAQLKQTIGDGNTTCPHCNKNTGVLKLLFRVVFEDVRCPHCGEIIENADMCRRQLERTNAS